MHALGTYALVHTLMSSLMVAWGLCGFTIADKGVVVAAPAWVTAGKPSAVVGVEVLGY